MHTCHAHVHTIICANVRDHAFLAVGYTKHDAPEDSAADPPGISEELSAANKYNFPDSKPVVT